MKPNPFTITPYRRQPNRRYAPYQCQRPINRMVDGMVTLGEVAVIGGTTVGILQAFQK